MTVAHSDRRYNMPDRIWMHTAQKTHELGESPSDKVGVSGEPVSGLAKAAPGQEAQGGSGAGCARWQRWWRGTEAGQSREKIEKKLGIFESREPSPQVHLAVLAVWVSLAANKLKKAAAGPAAERVFWVGRAAHVGARGAAAALCLNPAPAAGAPGVQLQPLSSEGPGEREREALAYLHNSPYSLPQSFRKWELNIK